PDAIPVLRVRGGLRLLLGRGSQRRREQEPEQRLHQASSLDGGGLGFWGMTGRRLTHTSSPTTLTGKHFMWMSGLPVYSQFATSNSQAWREQRTYFSRKALLESWKPACGQKSREA